MAAATTRYEGMIRDKRGNSTMGPEDRLVVWGYGAFTTTGTTVELDVTVESIECFLANAKAAPGAGEQLGSDGVISSEAITVARQTGTTSGLGYWYFYIGVPAVSFDPYD